MISLSLMTSSPQVPPNIVSLLQRILLMCFSPHLWLLQRIQHQQQSKSASPFTCILKATLKWRAGRKKMTWRKPERCTIRNSRPHQIHWLEFESGAFATRIQNIKTLQVRFRVHYVTHFPRQILAVTGNHHYLGAWKSFIPLRRAEDDGFWFCTIIFPMDIHVKWKFILVEDGEIVCWEECRNQQLEVPRKVEDEEIQLYCTWGYH